MDCDSGGELAFCLFYDLGSGFLEATPGGGTLREA